MQLQATCACAGLTFKQMAAQEYSNESSAEVQIIK